MDSELNWVATALANGLLNAILVEWAREALGCLDGCDELLAGLATLRVDCAALVLRED